MKQGLLLIGGGGHCRSCIDVIEQENRFSIFGILDTFLYNKGLRNILGYSILGGDELMESLVSEVTHAFIAIGQIKSADLRIKIYQKLKQIGYNLPIIISPLAYVARNVSIGEGSIIMHHALINTNVSIGKSCIINSKALIEHDSIIGDFCHLSTASVVNGTCNIGNGTFIGSNMILKHNSTIAPNSILYHNPLEISSIKQGGGGN
ncbi:acetyltransferase [Helicobacter rodentium]|uniref:acetyltransferase n=1 Tax=Helicobacter rodentium TaxID=59617 RepID=UPI00235657D5|nr:acetyltransferase [Helicobacter rodentium]